MNWEMKRRYTAWLYVSFIVYRDIFALHVHLFYARPDAFVFSSYGYVLVSLAFLHANITSVWRKGNWPQGFDWNRVKKAKPLDYDGAFQNSASEAIFKTNLWDLTLNSAAIWTSAEMSLVMLFLVDFILTWAVPLPVSPVGFFFITSSCGQILMRNFLWSLI